MGASDPVNLVNNNWAWIKPTWEPVWPAHTHVYIFLVNDGALVNTEGFNGTHSLCNNNIHAMLLAMETTRETSGTARNFISTDP